VVEAKFKHVYEDNASEQIEEARAKYNYKETIVYGLQPLLDMHSEHKIPF
jgi:hypothetical protein